MTTGCSSSSSPRHAEHKPSLRRWHHRFHSCRRDLSVAALLFGRRRAEVSPVSLSVGVRLAGQDTCRWGRTKRPCVPQRDATATCGHGPSGSPGDSRRRGCASNRSFPRRNRNFAPALTGRPAATMSTTRAILPGMNPKRLACKARGHRWLLLPLGPEMFGISCSRCAAVDRVIPGRKSHRSGSPSAFTESENWSGGWYELAMEFDADPPLQHRAIRAAAAAAQVEGCYSDKSREPAEQD